MFISIVLCVLIASFAFAHEGEEEAGYYDELGYYTLETNEQVLQLKGYDIHFMPTEKFHVEKESTFTIEIIKSDGSLAEGMDVQGQIYDPNIKNEIFYTLAKEIAPGKYSFSWKPGFAGTYVAQFIYRASDDEMLQPSFLIQVDDPRAQYWFIGAIILAIVCIIWGLYAALPRKRKKFNIKPLLTGLVIGIVFIGLGYSVSYFYQAGGEKGFIICDEKGCDIAVHRHSKLHMTVCGKPYHLPHEGGSLSSVHTHKKADRLHFHALTKVDEKTQELLEPEKLSIGLVFERLGIRFTDTCFTDYCNGDACPDGTSGTLSMIVNDVPNEEFNTYSYKDGDEIRIIFR